ncbi:MAG: S8 family serine peptidase [Paludibacteraceae bacterium]
MGSIFGLILSVYFVQFADKAGSTPVALTDRAIAQRAQWNIATDSLDYGVSPVYTDSLRKMGGRIYHTSRWMNGATVELDESTAEKVKQCRFVRSIEMTRDETAPSAYLRRKKEMLVADDGATHYGLAEEQLRTYNLPALHQAGFEGQGIRIAVCDGGFSGADTLSCFDTERRLGHMDFTDDKSDFFGTDGTHGTACLSLIAAQTSNFAGSASGVEYYLMRAEEDATESPKEMDNLVAALEAADSLGVNIFSASLGYSEFDNSAWNLGYEDMDGKQTRCSRAATIAARKGMLVCIAAGNEGNKAWHYITAPADADSILTVGAVRTDGTIAAFSSRGPSADGRAKPEVCAVGYATYVFNPIRHNFQQGNGTSYACPLTAGLAACLWSAFPQETAMQIRQRILESANRYQQPDNDYGYGIPDAWAAYAGTTELHTTSLPSESVRKVFYRGKIYIVRGNAIYDMLGRTIDTKKG